MNNNLFSHTPMNGASQFNNQPMSGNTNPSANSLNEKKERNSPLDDVLQFMDGWFGHLTDIFAILVVIAAVVLLTNSGGVLYQDQEEDQVSGKSNPIDHYQEDTIVPSFPYHEEYMDEEVPRQRGKITNQKHIKKSDESKKKKSSSETRRKDSKTVNDKEPSLLKGKNEKSQQKNKNVVMEMNEDEQVDIEQVIDNAHGEEDEGEINNGDLGQDSKPNQPKNMKQKNQKKKTKVMSVEDILDEEALKQNKEVNSDRSWLSNMFNNDENNLPENGEEENIEEVESVIDEPLEKKSSYHQKTEKTKAIAHSKDKYSSSKEQRSSATTKNAKAQKKSTSLKNEKTVGWLASLFDVDGDYSKDLDPESNDKSDGSWFYDQRDNFLFEQDERENNQVKGGKNQDTNEPAELVDERTVWEGWNFFDKVPGVSKEDEEIEKDGIVEVLSDSLSWVSNFLANDEETNNEIESKGTENKKIPLSSDVNDHKDKRSVANKERDQQDKKNSLPETKTSHQNKNSAIVYVGIDDTHTPWCTERCPKGECPSHLCTAKTHSDLTSNVICADNRYKTLPGKTFLCQASCNQPPFHCPAAHCACENSDMESNKRCSSPRFCNLNEYLAVPNTIATNAWCNSTCNAGEGRYCPCTLCECSVLCTQGIVNGDFSKGLAGWKTLRQSGSLGDIYASVAGQPAPATGKDMPNFYSDSSSDEPTIAIMDHSAPGSYVLYQEYRPTRGDILQFSWVVQNFAKSFHVQEDTLSTNVFRNQQFRVDIMSPSTESWFDTSSTSQQDVLATILSPEKVKNIMTALGSPPYQLVSPWQTMKYDLTPFAGKKILIAFRAVHNQGIMNVGITRVQIKNKICTTPPVGNAGPPQRDLASPLMQSVGKQVCGELCQNVYAHAA